MAAIVAFKLLDDDSTLERCDLHPILSKKAALKEAAVEPGGFGGNNHNVAFQRNGFVSSLCSPKPQGVSLGAFDSDMIYARELTIIHGENPCYWKWKWLPEAPDVEAAELLNVCWLEVKGKYDMNKLAPRKRYELFFVIKIENNIDFDSPVKFELELPDGTEHSRNVNLMKLKPRNSWVLVKLGKAVGTWKGEIKFSLVNLSPLWKRGITIAGVRIEPIV